MGIQSMSSEQLFIHEIVMKIYSLFPAFSLCPSEKLVLSYGKRNLG